MALKVSGSPGNVAAPDEGKATGDSAVAQHTPSASSLPVHTEDSSEEVYMC